MKYLYLIVVSVFGTLGFSQTQGINWLSWDELQAAQQIEPKKVFIDLEAKWCKTSKNLENITFENQDLVDYINTNFYAVKFDAESKQDIIIGGKTYKFRNSGKRGYHELAYKITHGKLMYPTLVFLDTNFEIIQAIEGYQGPERLKKVATYFANNYHTNKPWVEFSEEYNSYQLPIQSVSNKNP